MRRLVLSGRGAGTLGMQQQLYKADNDGAETFDDPIEPNTKLSPDAQSLEKQYPEPPLSKSQSTQSGGKPSKAMLLKRDTQFLAKTLKGDITLRMPSAAMWKQRRNKYSSLI